MILTVKKGFYFLLAVRSDALDGAERLLIISTD